MLMMDMLCMPVESLMQKAVEYREVTVSFLLCPALILRGSSPL